MAHSAAAALTPLYLDKDSVVHYNGDPSFGEEYEERCLLGYESQPTKETKASYAIRLKNGLTGRAWQLTHKKAEITTSKWMADAEKDSLAATKLMITTVRAACEWVAPLQKQTAFDELFFNGGRKAGEAVQDHISRRETEYERM